MIYQDEPENPVTDLDESSFLTGNIIVMKKLIKTIIATTVLTKVEELMEKKVASWMGKKKKSRTSWFGLHKRKEESHGFLAKALKFLSVGWRMA